MRCGDDGNTTKNRCVYATHPSLAVFDVQPWSSSLTASRTPARSVPFGYCPIAECLTASEPYNHILIWERRRVRVQIEVMEEAMAVGRKPVSYLYLQAKIRATGHCGARSPAGRLSRVLVGAGLLLYGKRTLVSIKRQRK